jgi:proteasome lid subunit RPN8/RPN11
MVIMRTFHLLSFFLFVIVCFNFPIPQQFELKKMKNFDEDLLDLLTAEDVGRLIKGILSSHPHHPRSPVAKNFPL